MSENDARNLKGVKIFVDPPSGWRYGFPKELKPGESYEELLRKSGYPEKDIQFALQWSKWSEEPSKD